MLDSGKVDENRFLGAIGKFFHVPVVSIDPKTIDRETLSILPSRFVFQHHILPIEVKENSVVLATYDLFNSIGRQLAAQLLKKPAEWVLVPRAQLLRTMKTLYGVGRGNIRRNSENQPRLRSVCRTGKPRTDLNADDPEASVVKFVNQIIREAIIERATDIHVEPLENDLAHSLSDRRHPARSGGAAAVARVAIRNHFAPESDGAHGHRRAALAAGWPDESARK